MHIHIIHEDYQNYLLNVLSVVHFTEAAGIAKSLEQLKLSYDDLYGQSTQL